MALFLYVYSISVLANTNIQGLCPFTNGDLYFFFKAIKLLLFVIGKLQSSVY